MIIIIISQHRHVPFQCHVHKMNELVGVFRDRIYAWEIGKFYAAKIVFYHSQDNESFPINPLLIDIYYYLYDPQPCSNYKAPDRQHTTHDTPLLSLSLTLCEVEKNW